MAMTFRLRQPVTTTPDSGQVGHPLDAPLGARDHLATGAPWTALAYSVISQFSRIGAAPRAQFAQIVVIVGAAALLKTSLTRA